MRKQIVLILGVMVCSLALLATFYNATADAEDDGAGDAQAEGDAFVQSLKLTVDGRPHKLTLEKMDVFLVEDEESDPEIYEIHGDGVVLVGTFPLNVHVGYEDDWSVLLKKPIAILPKGGDQVRKRRQPSNYPIPCRQM